MKAPVSVRGYSGFSLLVAIFAVACCSAALETAATGLVQDAGLQGASGAWDTAAMPPPRLRHFRAQHSPGKRRMMLVCRDYGIIPCPTCFAANTTTSVAVAASKRPPPPKPAAKRPPPVKAASKRPPPPKAASKRPPPLPKAASKRPPPPKPALKKAPPPPQSG